MVRLCPFLVFLAFATMSCQEQIPKNMWGDWSADLVVEMGDTLSLDLSNVHLQFIEEERQFSYRHTQLDSLSGTFDLDEDLVFLYIDAPKSDTIVVELDELEDDELVLRMNHEGKERFVTFVK